MTPQDQASIPEQWFNKTFGPGAEVTSAEDFHSRCDQINQKSIPYLAIMKEEE